ncbi:MAG TPA: hypothetical protein VFM48_05235 [Aquabacterium sp.]|nr:hypothetical protein [Aquabacterium sp.]
MLSCRAGGALWALRYVTVPDAPQVAQTLDWWHRDLAQRPGYVLKAMGALSVAGASSLEGEQAWQIDAGAATQTQRFGQAWHFSHGLTVFQASVWQAKPFSVDAREDDPVATFKTGFQFSG